MEVVSVLTEAELEQRLVLTGRSARPIPPYPVLFPERLIVQAASHLHQSGRRGLEQLVLWAGYPTPQGVALTTLLLPETEAEPLWVRIRPADQPKIVTWLRRYGQLLFVEAHTHGDGPFATELSEEDRRHPAGRQEGFLTMIVTGYARHGIDFRRAGVWECRHLNYQRVPSAEVTRRLRVVTDEEVRHVLISND